MADGIWFANGVALSPDGSFVAVVETAGMRVKRVWLTGEKAGHVDTLIDELPGYARALQPSPRTRAETLCREIGQES